MAHEAQTIRDCMALRQECQRQIFEHIDEKHERVMGVLGEIKGKLSYENGRASATAANAPVKPRRGLSAREIVLIITALSSAVTAAIYALQGTTAPPSSPTINVTAKE